MTPNLKRRILFATKNPGKFQEFKKTFEKLSTDHEIVSYNDLPYAVPDCEEKGATFEENALLKARNARSHLKNPEKDMIVVADDSGMEIDCLGGEPGVRTRRWAGHEMTDDEIIEYCLDKLRGEKDRSASYVSCFAISLPDGTEKTILDRSRGTILQAPRNSSQLVGMPFRSLFFVPELNIMFHEVRDLSPADRRGYKLGHEEAIQQIIQFLVR